MTAPRCRRASVVRALLVGALGLALGAVPTVIAVILASYAVLFLLGLPFLGLGARALAAWAVAWVVAAPVGAHLLRPVLPPHEVGSPEPGDVLRPGHLLCELLFTGYYPAAVWVAYLLAGMALGRLPLAAAGDRDGRSWWGSSSPRRRRSVHDSCCPVRGPVLRWVPPTRTRPHRIPRWRPTPRPSTRS